MEKLVDEIVVVDNGSTDGTLEILQNSLLVVSIDQTEGFDEGRDKILAYKRAKERNPDWILWVDIDEIFEDRLTRARLEKMMNSKTITKYWFRRFHLHNDEYHFEADFDKIYNISWPDRVLWKDQPTGYFKYEKIHCALIRGITGKNKISKYRIRHYGAVYKDYLKKKTDTYISVDPAQKDMYIKHRDQELKTWKWNEFKDSPFIVSLQIILLDCLFAYRFFLKKFGF